LAEAGRSYGEFEFWFASIKVAAIVVFIAVTGYFVLALTHGGARFANLHAYRGFAPFGPVSVLGGVTSVIFALCGAEIATIAAAESAEPGRAIARMTSQVVVRILLGDPASPEVAQRGEHEGIDEALQEFIAKRKASMPDSEV